VALCIHTPETLTIISDAETTSQGERTGIIYFYDHDDRIVAAFSPPRHPNWFVGVFDPDITAELALRYIASDQ